MDRGKTGSAFADRDFGDRLGGFRGTSRTFTPGDQEQPGVQAGRLAQDGLLRDRPNQRPDHAVAFRHDVEFTGRVQSQP